MLACWGRRRHVMLAIYSLHRRKACLALISVMTSVVCFLLTGHVLARWTLTQQTADFTHSFPPALSANNATQATPTWNTTVQPACLRSLFQMMTDKRSECHMEHLQEESDSPSPIHHVFFLKTHKTGSTTVASLLNRYALTYNLTVAIRKNLRAHTAESHTNWIADYRLLPPGLTHFDMLTDHVRFCEHCVRQLLPSDAKYVSIVREPLEAFVSAFYYYRDVWGYPHLKKVPGPNPITTFLSDMDSWDTKPGTCIHSKVVVDFGLQYSEIQDSQFLNASLHRLSHTFHLVLLTELFDESMVLFKRLMNWKLQDVLYVKVNVGPHRHPHHVTKHQRDEFEQHRRPEFALYRHFRDVFHHKMAAQDASFPDEVDTFKQMRSTVERYCVSYSTPGQAELIVKSTRFSQAFRVGYDDCLLLMRSSSSVKDTWFEKIMLERLKAFG